jgi:DNA-binding transcriptional regulator YdaS (Cro superfamily)
MTLREVIKKRWAGSQTELARLLGVSESYVSLCGKGLRVLRGRKAARLARLTGCTLAVNANGDLDYRRGRAKGAVTEPVAANSEVKGVQPIKHPTNTGPVCPF